MEPHTEEQKLNNELVPKEVEVEVEVEVEDEEEEEGVSLRGRRFNQRNNNAADAVFVSGNGNGGGNGNTVGNDASSSCSCSTSVDSETPNGSPMVEDVGGEKEGLAATLNGNSVYFDHQLGMWKCHHCNWTYCVGSLWTDHIQNPNGHECFIFETKGIESSNGLSEMKLTGVTYYSSETNSSNVDIYVENSDVKKNIIEGINLQYQENLSGGDSSGLILAPVDDSFEQKCLKAEPSNGIESSNGLSEMKLTGVTYYSSETNSSNVNICVENSDIKKNIIEGINLQYQENLSSEQSSGLILAPVDDSFEQKYLKAEPSNGKLRVEDLDVIEEIDQDLTELDVERVLEKQTTHDLFCPNCNSCITRRVILRRRKPKIRNTRRKPKQDKLETNLHLELDANSINSPNHQAHDIVNTCPNGSQALEANADVRNDEPDVFRCLSCFSLFIPTGNGFKLFRIFGDSPQTDRAQNAQKVNAANKNWLFSIFRTDKRTTTEQGTGNNAGTAVEVAGNETVSLLTEHIDSEGRAVHIVGVNSEIVTEKAKTGVDSVNHDSVDPVQEMNLQCSSDTTIFQLENGHVTSLDSTFLTTGETAEDASLIPLQDGTNSLDLSTCESEKPSQSQIKMDEKFDMEMRNEQSVRNEKASSIQGTPSVTDLFSKVEHVNYPENPMIEKVKTCVADKAVDAMTSGNDVIVIVGTGSTDPVSSQSARDVNVLVEADILPRSGEHTGSGFSVEILKSIVYGGLVESITSLGIVSSAAGAGTGTLNILALSLANLIGGLFVIGQSLVDLKNESSGGSSNDTNVQEDRYQRTLGRRENFSLHAIVAILSFIILGLLPPVIYGFSFRKSDDKDLKLAVAGGASLVFIILLAVGKAHVQRQPRSYIRAVMHYVSLGIMASGASYIAGDLLNKLLEKEGWFESNSAFMVPFPETTLPTTMSTKASASY